MRVIVKSLLVIVLIFPAVCFAAKGYSIWITNNSAQDIDVSVWGRYDIGGCHNALNFLSPAHSGQTKVCDLTVTKAVLPCTPKMYPGINLCAVVKVEFDDQFGGQYDASSSPSGDIARWYYTRINGDATSAPNYTLVHSSHKGNLYFTASDRSKQSKAKKTAKKR